MLKNFIGSVWRRFPKKFRRWTVERLEAQFTVTVAAVIIDDQKRVLLLKHVFRPGSGWGIPGGFINAREQPETAVRRELREEIGLELSDVKLLTVITHKHVNQVIIAYVCRPEGNFKGLSFEINEAGWFGVDELPSGLPQDQVALIKYASDSREKIDRQDMLPEEI